MRRSGSSRTRTLRADAVERLHPGDSDGEPRCVLSTVRPFRREGVPLRPCGPAAGPPHEPRDIRSLPDLNWRALSRALQSRARSLLPMHLCRATGDCRPRARRGPSVRSTACGAASECLCMEEPVDDDAGATNDQRASHDECTHYDRRTLPLPSSGVHSRIKPARRCTAAAAAAGGVPSRHLASVLS